MVLPLHFAAVGAGRRLLGFRMTRWRLILQTLSFLFSSSTVQPFREMAAGSRQEDQS